MKPGHRITEILLFPQRDETAIRKFIITYDDGTFIKDDTVGYNRFGTPALDLVLVAFVHFLNIKAEDVEVLACDAAL